MTTAHIVFWVSMALLAYTFAGYPLLIRLWSALAPRPVRRRGELTPSIAVVVVAYNEEARIRAKIENLLALDWPRDSLEIVIASDASTDRTADIAREYAGRGVRVVELPERRGKPAALNAVVPHLDAEIAVLMDVRQRIEPQALRELAANFADPGVGAVSGELFLEGKGEDATGEGVGFYWRYEKFIRLHESRADSTVGATGAIYAVRRALFQPIPERTLIDDVLIPMRIVRQGYRVLFEPRARAWDQVSATAEAEFTRKVRTIAGNFQLLLSEPWLLSPFANRLWFQTVSHKFCRLLGPLCLLAAFVANLFLLDSVEYRLLLALQVFFYGVAIAGHIIRNPQRKPRLVNVAYAFCVLNWATVVGFSRFVFGRQRVTWQKAKH